MMTRTLYAVAVIAVLVTGCRSAECSFAPSTFALSEYSLHVGERWNPKMTLGNDCGLPVMRTPAAFTIRDTTIATFDRETGVVTARAAGVTQIDDGPRSMKLIVLP